MDAERGPEGLFAAIGDQAAGERNAVLAEAEARARDILARADAEVGRLRTEAMKRLERELAAEGERLLGEARMAARNDRLAVKRRLLAEAFSRARAELASAAGNPRGLAALAAEALAAAGDGGKVETDEARGTVVAHSRDGRTRVENSLLTRLARAETIEEAEVSRVLFGPGGEGGGGRQGTHA